MDVLKDDFFDDYADDRNGGKRTAPAPNGENGANGANGSNGSPLPQGSNGRPFPDGDYNKRGKLRTVRGRVLKKLLKYEFKAYLNPMLIMFAALFAIAITLCILGSSLTEADWNYSSENAGKMLSWTIALVVFVWVAFTAVFFPLGFGTKRYHKQFFTSQGYLTLSIPASPEEQILAKRIAVLTAMAVGLIGAFIAIVIAFLPVLGYMGGDVIAPSDPSETAQVNGWDVLYVILEFLLTPILLASACGAFACWRHRGLKTWMIVLLGVCAYMLSTVLAVLTAGLSVELHWETWQTLLTIGKWVFFFIKCGVAYLLFRYETQTLRKKINLK